MNVTEILRHRKKVRLILMSGLYHPATAAFSGKERLEALRRLNLNKAFISAGGVHRMRRRHLLAFP